MRPVALVVPACYPDIFAAFLGSLDAHAAAWPFARKILVRDEERIEPPRDWLVIQGASPYVMPRNINMGLKAASGCDVVMASDDTQFTDTGSLAELQAAAYSHEDIAIVSPQIDGGCGNAEQKSDSPWGSIEAPQVAFIFIYVKRAIIDLIGGWDEQFTTYGHDDYDYCRRVGLVGKKIFISAEIVVKHGFHAPCMNTYSRKSQADTAAGARIFAAKWGEDRWRL